MKSTEFSLRVAKDLDSADPLSKYRDRFHHPKQENGKDKLYFTGNSLGLCPTSVDDYLQTELHAWKTLGSRGHVLAPIPWIEYHHSVKSSLAKIVGGLESEVIAMNSLTTNLHLMMTSFYNPIKGRDKILVLEDCFPSDRYAVTSQIRSHGLVPEETLIEVGPRPDQTFIDEHDVAQLIEQRGHEIALVLIEGVSYLTGQWFDLPFLAKVARQKGCMVGFDLAHAVGNVPLALHDWEVDFAVWCNYKYLNGGPGTVGGCFVHEKHGKRKNLSRLAGWWGHDESRRFLMEKTFSAMDGVDGWCLSNAPVLLIAALRASMEIFDEVGMKALREKSVQLTGFLEMGLQHCCEKDVKVLTPSQPHRRGAQLSLSFPGEGKKMFDDLNRNGVVCDWREPNVIRISPAPLYTRYQDVYQFVELLSRV
ncbi:MAG: kynureninase [Bdellovibrionota bacterium]